jgi:ABC-type methionine transport system permease subunit
MTITAPFIIVFIIQFSLSNLIINRASSTQTMSLRAIMSTPSYARRMATIMAEIYCASITLDTIIPTHEAHIVSGESSGEKIGGRLAWVESEAGVPDPR